MLNPGGNIDQVAEALEKKKIKWERGNTTIYSYVIIIIGLGLRLSFRIFYFLLLCVLYFLFGPTGFSV